MTDPHGSNGAAAPPPPPPTGSVPPAPPSGSGSGSAGGPFTLGEPAAVRAWGAPPQDAPSQDAPSQDAPSQDAPAMDAPSGAPAPPAPAPVPPTSYGEQRAGLFDAVPRSAEPEPPLFGTPTPTPEPPAPPAEDPELTLLAPPAAPQRDLSAPSIGGLGGPSLPPNDQDTYPGAPSAPHDADGRRTPVLIGAVVLALLVVGLAAFLLVRWLGDDGESADGGDAATASTVVASSVPEAPADEAPATEDTTADSTALPPAPAVVVTGVVHLTGQGTDDCASVGVDRMVRVTADGSSDVATVALTGGSELGRTGEGGAAQLHCEYRYEVGLPEGPSTYSFSLEAGGAPEDVREVSAEELRSGTGPFLGTVYVPG